MSKKLSGVKVRKVRRALRKLGYQRQPKRGKGSHEQYRHPKTGAWTTVSWKQNGTVPTGTVKRIASDIGLTTEEFLEVL